MTMKRDRIYRTLRERIVSGKYPPGKRLPSETDLAPEFGVARDTLRDALRLLEEEGLIERVKSRGTFVRQPKPDSSERVISFLIPFPEYMTSVNRNFTPSFTEIFYGAVQAAAEAHWRVQTVAFSRTNDNRDIDWESLSCIQKDSRVIIFNHWYDTAFDVFLKRGIRAGFIREDYPLSAVPWGKYAERWVSGIFKAEKAVGEAFRAMRAGRCRRAVLISRYIRNADFVTELCRRNAEKNRIVFSAADPYGPQYAGLSTFEAVRRIQKETSADLLLFDRWELCPGESTEFHAMFGIPDRARILLLSRPGIPEGRFSFFLRNNYEMGYRIAKLLMKPFYVPETIRLDLEFSEQKENNPHTGA